MTALLYLQHHKWTPCVHKQASLCCHTNLSLLFTVTDT